MDNSAFLLQVLGDKGFKTLSKISEKYPLLDSVLVPRTIISWIETVGKLGFEGAIPGQDGSYFSLNKSENNQYTGALTINEDLYTFDKADILHVAASVGVALDLKLPPVDESLKKKDLTKLGKSIDLLVKTEFIRENTDNSKYKIKLAKSVNSKLCPECGVSYFKDDECKLCFCLGDLKKHIKTKVLDDGYLIKFDQELDDEAIETVVSALKR